MRSALLAFRLLLALVPGMLCIGGCATVRTSDPPRTATEQLLMSGATTRAIDQLAFDMLRGRLIYLDATYLVNPERDFAIAEMRAKMLLAGVQFRDRRDEADIVVELRSGGIGIDRYDYLLGIPVIQIAGGSGMGTADVPLVTPELALIKNVKQYGLATIAVVAYWRDTGEVVVSSGPAIGRTHREDWWFLGMGPTIIGDIPSAARESE